MEATQTQILGRALDLLIEKGWTQNAYARNNGGAQVAAEHPGAESFCTVGALWRAKAELAADDIWYIGALGAMAKAIGTGQLPKWNDAQGRTKEEVLEAFARAIEKSRPAVAEEDLVAV